MSEAAIAELRELVKALRFNAAEVSARTAEIYRSLLEDSKTIRTGNFEVISNTDLVKLFELYDWHFFEGLLLPAAGRVGETMTFRLSKRMTSAGGTTTRRTLRQGGSGKPLGYWHEIAVSTTLLFQTFHDVDRPITVTGILCRDRLEALQRIFEHEITHLLELLIWNNSSCSAQRFAGLATGIFGHKEMTHQLITPRERAREKFGIRPGDRVSFVVEGKRFQGIVNRITKRATVLVPDAKGELFSDGKRYLRFYVPVGMLERVG